MRSIATMLGGLICGALLVLVAWNVVTGDQEKNGAGAQGPGDTPRASPSAGSSSPPPAAASTGPATPASVPEANRYWNEALSKLRGGASMQAVFPASFEVPQSASPEVNATPDEYMALVLGQIPGSPRYGLPIDVSKGLTAQDLEAEIRYLEGLNDAGSYNPDLAMISNRQAVDSLIASERSALSAGLFP